MKSLLAAVLLCSASLVFAHCPNVPVCEMKAIDSLLPETKLQGADLEKVKSLRTEGQKLYDEGRESDAAKLLKEARKILKDAASCAGQPSGARDQRIFRVPIPQQDSHQAHGTGDFPGSVLWGVFASVELRRVVS
ncbi:MAG: hypothetical protein ACKOAO_09980 [Oxalobacteraceae bacterium]